MTKIEAKSWIAAVNELFSKSPDRSLSDPSDALLQPAA